MEAQICKWCCGLNQSEHSSFTGDKIGIMHVGEYETCCNEDGDETTHSFRKCDRCTTTIMIEED